MSISSKIRNLVLKFGVEINRYNPLQSNDSRMINLLKHNQINLVVDVGANDGGYASYLRSIGYEGKIISFEPLFDAHEKLKNRAVNDKNWFVAPRSAVGNFDGEITINVSSNSVSSSILKIEAAHVEACLTSSYKAKENCSIIKLDSFKHESLTPDSNIFLKIDTQGYEHFVLEGASEFLKKAKGVQIEMSLIYLYEGQKLYFELTSMLMSSGFTLWNVVPGFSEPKTGRMLQIDGVFFK